MLALGLMSGTSLDGVDAALAVTDGVAVERLGQSLTVPYDPGLRSRLRAVLGGVGEVAAVEHDVTLFHAEVVRRLLAEAGLSPAEIDVVGFHGHTILHRPDQRRTWQIGDGQLLADALGIPVVNDFRSADVAAGGQGAPLVPVFHRALAAGLPRPLAVLNLGGVGNVTWIGADDALLAFDTGPGNALLDDWALAHTGRPVDAGGALARAGRADMHAVAGFTQHEYFDRRPPKSLDRDDFRAHAARLVAGKAAADGAATLTAFTARSVALALPHLPEPPARWLVCGGGRHNPEVMAALAAELGVPVDPVEVVGWDGDALEAQAFAYLAVRSLRGLPLTFPGTTGGPAPCGGGRSHAPSGRLG
ncbi:MAG: anhydro-N-acetylmuramic acid kinase [Pseudomonadota bacterium]